MRARDDPRLMTLEKSLTKPVASVLLIHLAVLLEVALTRLAQAAAMRLTMESLIVCESSVFFRESWRLLMV